MVDRPIQSKIEISALQRKYRRYALWRVNQGENARQVVLLALLPAKQASSAGAAISEPRFAER
jgi:hypothetical protein